MPVESTISATKAASFMLAGHFLAFLGAMA
jgi:hypothetical protein